MRHRSEAAALAQGWDFGFDPGPEGSIIAPTMLEKRVRTTANFPAQRQNANPYHL